MGDATEAAAHADTDFKSGPLIADAIARFFKNVDALRSTLPLAMLAANSARHGLRTKYHNFLKQHGTLQSETAKTATFSVPVEFGTRARKLSEELDRVETGIELAPRIFLVALVSEYDFFVGSLLRWFYEVCPDALNASDKQFTFSELSKFGSIEAAREFILEKEIETFLRENHVDQFKTLERKLGIPLTKGLAFPAFIEVTERRNLFVHTNGVVSRQYLAVCKANGATIPDSVVLGAQLQAPPDYFSSAANCILEIGVKLSQVAWRKMQPDDLEAADGSLVSTTFNLLERQRYPLAANLLDFACETLKKHGSEKLRRIHIINRAQAYKWLEDEGMCKKILDNEDWSAAELTFLRAVCVLRDDFESAKTHMRSLGKTGSIGTTQYQDWPLFQKFRQSAEFLGTYKEIFGSDYAEFAQKKDIATNENTSAEGASALPADADKPSE